MSRRVVITGLGCITPLGSHPTTVWSNLLQGKSGIDRIRSFDAGPLPVQIAAEVTDWDMSAVGLDPDDWESYPPQTRFAVGAALQAVAKREAGRRAPDQAPVVLDPAVLGAVHL